MTHTEDYRGRPGFHGWRHASAGGPTEDPTKGFKFGGWAMPYFDQESGEELDRLFKKFDLLLGRKTYEIFAAYWPYYDEDASHGSIAKFRARARSIRVGRAQCSCATSPT